MTETQPSSTVPTAAPTQAAPEAKAAPKVKQTRTPKQLAQLQAAREKRKAKKQQGGGSIARSDSGEEFIKRIERAEPEAREKKSTGKRKREARGISFDSPTSYAMGALALAGLGIAAYQAKKKGGGSMFGQAASSQQQQPQPQNLNTANLFGGY